MVDHHPQVSKPRTPPDSESQPRNDIAPMRGAHRLHRRLPFLNMLFSEGTFLTSRPSQLASTCLTAAEGTP